MELATVAFVLKIWRHYLYGTKYEVYTGHQSLKSIFTQKKLNLRQRRWLELVKIYDIDICYHPRKASKVANAFSRKSSSSLMLNQLLIEPLQKELIKARIELVTGSLAALVFQPTILIA